MTVASAESRPRATTLAVVATVAAYGFFGAILFVTRFVGLERSFWHDEIVTVRQFVREGPCEILTGAYIPNNHQLFSLLAWATSSVVGESEVALRLWSVVPFVLGVVLVTAWLHVRLGALAGILFLFLATGAPLLLDITRQARGYGLAFFAMSVVVVAALEVDQRPSRWWLAAFFGGGLIGTLTFPQFGIAFVATAVVLLTKSELRARVLGGFAVTALASVMWYAPHFDDLRENSRQVYGARIGPFGVITAPFDQILIPALLRYGGVGLTGIKWLPVVALALVFVAWSPLLRWNRRGAILATGVFATLIALWATRTYVVPRFLSFLLVPLLMLAASGAAAILTRSPRPPLVRSVLALATVGALVLVFVPPALEIATLPREANADAARLVQEKASPTAEIYPHVLHPRTLSFYLDVPLQPRPTQRYVPRLCSRPSQVVLVEQPWVLTPLHVPCLARAGVEHYRLEQYSRGREINVWIVPPRS